MHLLMDQNVPPDVWRYFQGRGHKVQFVSELFGPETPDPVIVEGASRVGAIVVTFNHRHFRPLSSRCAAGLITFTCREKNARGRLKEDITEIEEHYDQFVSGKVSTFFVEVGKKRLRIHT